MSDFGSVLTHVFRARLSKGLSILSRYVKEIEEDERISDLLRILRERDVGDNFSEIQSKEHITMESLDAVSFIIIFLKIFFSIKLSISY